MDVLFGTVSLEAREAFIRKEGRALSDANEVSSLQSGEAKL
jgi:hypothetical protein